MLRIPNYPSRKPVSASVDLSQRGGREGITDQGFYVTGTGRFTDVVLKWEGPTPDSSRQSKKWASCRRAFYLSRCFSMPAFERAGSGSLCLRAAVQPQPQSEHPPAVRRRES